MLVVSEDRLLYEFLEQALPAWELPITGVSHAPDSLTALRLAEDNAPAIVLLNLHLPDMDGIGLARRIRGISRKCAMVLSTLDTTSALLVDTRQISFDAVVLRIAGNNPGETVLAKLRTALAAVSQGRGYFDPEYLRILASAQEGDGLGLTDCERQSVARLIGGATYREIAADMGVSPRTVEGHLASSKRKLGCSTKRDLIRIAHQNGIRPVPVELHNGM